MQKYNLQKTNPLKETNIHMGTYEGNKRGEG
jgi:hypothetical protein